VQVWNYELASIKSVRLYGLFLLRTIIRVRGSFQLYRRFYCQRVWWRYVLIPVVHVILTSYACRKKVLYVLQVIKR